MTKFLMKFKLTLGFILGTILVVLFIFSAALVAVIDYRVTSKLDGVLWTVPAKIYSRPLELAEGSKVNVDNLIREIEMLSYIADNKADSPGQFFLNKNKLKVFLRGYQDQPSGIYEITFAGGTVKNLSLIHI